MDYNDVSQWAADLGSGYSRIYPLGEGGMGTLYCAHKDSLDVDVVIKRVKQKFKGRMDERAEANILKTLKHKYLPRIYDVIESQSGYVYTIMDMIPGVNMQKYVETLSAKLILSGNVHQGDTILIDRSQDGLEAVIKPEVEVVE